MTREQKIEAIEAIAIDIGGKVDKEYYGRGMYGETCYAIICDDRDEAFESAGVHGMRGACIDQLGKGYVLYWPSIPTMAHA